MWGRVGLVARQMDWALVRVAVDRGCFFQGVQQPPNHSASHPNMHTCTTNLKQGNDPSSELLPGPAATGTSRWRPSRTCCSANRAGTGASWSGSGGSWRLGTCKPRLPACTTSRSPSSIRFCMPFAIDVGAAAATQPPCPQQHGGTGFKGRGGGWCMMPQRCTPCAGCLPGPGTTRPEGATRPRPHGPLGPLPSGQ